MIGCLTGQVKALQLPFVILDVAGVGYEVETPLSTFCQLKEGETATLWTHMVVREDAQLLYGFLTVEDKSIFRVLLKVNGVGPKMAVGILATFTPSQLVQAIASENLAALVKIPGVGKKTAERLLIELRDRLKDNASTTTGETQSAINHMHFQPSASSEAIQALMSLGYKPSEAEKAVNMTKGDLTEVADMIRAALKGMAKA